MGSKGRMPPPYHHRPLPGPGSGPPHGMMHRDPYGPGMHQQPGPGPYPYDMLPPPEILEQKLAAQCGEIQKLALENERLAASHASLRKELAAAQQELQRIQAQGEAAKVAEEQEMRGLLDKAAKMEADLKSYESVKADLQQAHAEAQNLAAARQHLLADAQKLNKDLQRNFGEAQQLPVLKADLDAARQEYQHLRAAYEYERKLKMDHSESLQGMKKNYDSMVTELEKLRAELTNTTNIDRSGTLYNPNFAQKDGGTSSHHSAYDGGYGVAQARTPPGMPDPLSGSPAGTAPRSGYDPSRGNSYGQIQAPSYAHTQMPPSYGLAQASSHFAPTQGGSPYGLSAQPQGYGSAQAAPNIGGAYQAPHGRR
ncbi:unnamed protein product [Triticum turgidum subsp. durum]|uniref:Protein FLX-like 2 n=1 Tax=Triticum turgidum subsp. durum TaxID=4567 RepID=A0A9R0XYW0_TRITD|nr:unnamed protein product [Triticum turgidum subsp. durum]